MSIVLKALQLLAVAQVERDELDVDPDIDDVVLSNTELREDAATGLVAYILTAGGTSPFTYELVDDGDGKFEILNDNELHLAEALGAETDVDIEIGVVDDNDKTLAKPFTIDVIPTEEPPPDDPGIGEDDGEVIDDGGFEVPPVPQTVTDGLRFTGKNGGLAKFIYDIGTPQAGDYDYIYEADWAALSNLGREAFVGFGFKQDDDFHFVGLKGNGLAGGSFALRKYQISGAAKFNGNAAPDYADGGNAANGTKDGPNQIRLRVKVDGTYEFYTGNGSGSFTLALSGAPGPLDSAFDATEFGLAVFLENSDKGPFLLTVTEWIGAGAGQPIGLLLSLTKG